MGNQQIPAESSRINQSVTLPDREMFFMFFSAPVKHSLGSITLILCVIKSKCRLPDDKRFRKHGVSSVEVRRSELQQWIAPAGLTPRSCCSLIIRL